MPLQIPAVLGHALLTELRRALANARWIDGVATAGHLSQAVKHNRQLPEMDPLAIDLGNRILDVLERHPLFMSYALPAKIVPPLFNAYRSAEHYGRHIDGAIRPIAGHSIRMRSDISATLFLTDPDDYVGGELIIEDAECGEPRTYKLAAGTLLLYPSGSVHHVAPVTSGERMASFFWIQSMVRSSTQRLALFDLDRIIQTLHTRLPRDPCLVDLTGHYHQLLRLWADI